MPRQSPSTRSTASVEYVGRLHFIIVQYSVRWYVMRLIGHWALVRCTTDQIKTQFHTYDASIRQLCNNNHYHQIGNVNHCWSKCDKCWFTGILCRSVKPDWVLAGINLHAEVADALLLLFNRSRIFCFSFFLWSTRALPHFHRNRKIQTIFRNKCCQSGICHTPSWLNYIINGKQRHMDLSFSVCSIW